MNEKYGVPYGAVVNLQEALHGIKSQQCDIPPPGWYCTRTAGHEGPCAAIAIPAAPVDAQPTANEYAPLPAPPTAAGKDKP